MKHWVADQQDFFDRARNKRRQQLAIWRGLGLAVYFIAVPFQLMAFFDPAQQVSGIQSTISDVFGLGPLVAALILVYLRNLAYAEQHRQYATMFDVYAKKRAELERLSPALPAQDEDDVRRRVVALGKESLSENADWSLMLRGRMLEIPAHLATLWALFVSSLIAPATGKRPRPGASARAKELGET